MEDYFDPSYTLDDVAEAKKNRIPYPIFYYRVMEYHWDVDRAKTEPVNKRTVVFTPEQERLMKENKIARSTAHSRIRNGMSPDEAVTKPIKKEIFTPEQKRLMKENNIHRSTAHTRVRDGMTPQEAVTRPVDKRFWPKGKH